MSDSDNPDGNRNDVLSKADEFLKRRRVQLGSAAASGALPAETTDDIPVLTEVVGSTEFPAIKHAVRNNISIDVARELDAWLDENLPQAVVHAMDGITGKLIQQVHESVRKELLPRLKHALSNDTEPGED